MPSAVRASHASSFLLVLFLFVAFFPGVFHYLFWSLPLAVITADPSRLSFTSSARDSSFSFPSSNKRYASSPSARMSWFQTQFTLPARARGSYLITDTVTKELPEIKNYKAHIKSALIGASVSIPISNGKLATGTWQGIWYLEFRAHKHSRKIVATIQGEKM
ncbi:hypothetical protein RB595_000545 [Gaeumannomyces hyphopodioides]